MSVINHILPRVEFCRLCRRLRVSAHSLLPQIALSCITPVKPPPVNTRLIYNVVLRDRCLFAEYSRRIYHALRINFLRPRKRTPMRKTDYMHRARRNFKRKFLSTDAIEKRGTLHATLLVTYQSAVQLDALIKHHLAISR